MRSAILLVLVPLVVGNPVLASASAFDEIERAQRLLAETASLLKQAEPDERLAALGRAVSAHEAALAAYRGAFRALGVREAELLGGIDADRGELQRLLGALQSLSRAPESALFAYPGGPVNAARSATLLAGISDPLDARITELRNRLDQLQTLRDGQDLARAELRGTLGGLQALRTETAKAQRRGRTPEISSVDDPAGWLDRGVRTLDQLASVLDTVFVDSPIGLETVAFSEMRGLLPLPVRGNVTSGFGSEDPWGRPGKGLSVAVPAYAQVTAPWDATVRYAGPLIDYGQVIVLEPETDYLLVLAGVGETAVQTGQTVLTGQPIGGMAGPLPETEEFLLEAREGDVQIELETVYIELRHDGRALDPADWFDLTTQEAKG